MTSGSPEGILASSLLESFDAMPWTPESREKYNSTYAEWSPERKQHNLDWQKARRDAKAIAEGREPGKRGRPPRLTAEEKEASRIAQNKRRSKQTAARIKAKRAAEAEAKGRVPGQVGGMRRLTDEERHQNRLATFAAYRARNLEEIRDADKATKKAERDARAIAEGRVPGIVGTLSRLTVAELEDYLTKWPDPSNVFHGRLKSQNSRAKRLGCHGVLTLIDVYDVIAEQAGHCAFCAQPFGDEVPELDHWEPLARGGSNTRDNLRLLHLSCNRTKGAKRPHELGLAAAPEG